MNETGTVKFQYQSNRRRLDPFPGLERLNAARQELRALGLLGLDEHGVGFGNLSLRDGPGFYVSGSGTGGLVSLGREHYTKVVAWDFERNWVRSEGLAIPSAESLTHAAIYEMDPEVRVVVHGHDQGLWWRLLDRGLASAADAAYGTPAMARQAQQLFRNPAFHRAKIFAMAGHENGIIACGESFEETLMRLRREIGKEA